MPQTERNNQIVEQEKPLNQTQLKNLRELVDGDFGDLQQEVVDEIDRRLRTRLEQIDEQFRANADLEKARKVLRDDVARTKERLVNKVAKQTEKNGIELLSNSGRSIAPEEIVQVSIETNRLKQKGRDEARNKAQEAADTLKQTARRVIAREQRQVDRQCLLQGISATGAHELIRDLPEAADILPLVSAEMATKESDAMSELMSEAEVAALSREEDA